MRDLCEMLQENAYPGRGIVIGRDTRGEMCVYYFIMGRSSNSRNRVFEECEDGIRTQAHDPAKLEDASLIIYHPVRKMRDCLVVTNGDQTDTIVGAIDDLANKCSDASVDMCAGESAGVAEACVDRNASCAEMSLGFRVGCMAREYEPDAPSFTPRISAIVHEDGAFEMSILKADVEGMCAKSNGCSGEPVEIGTSPFPRCVREFFAYEGCNAGVGRFISTYEGDGNPLPSFSGEPVHVKMPAPEDVWSALNAENKVSLYANVSGHVKIFNKNLGD